MYYTKGIWKDNSDKIKKIPNKLTAEQLWEKYADADGLISLKILEKYGWTQRQAEQEGLLIKETFHKYNEDNLTDNDKTD